MLCLTPRSLVFLSILQLAVSGSSEDDTSSSHFVTAPTSPPDSSSTLSSAPKRLIYQDEDPAAARLAWFRERSHPGILFVSTPLRHPSEAYREELEAKEREKNRIFRFSAIDLPRLERESVRAELFSAPARSSRRRGARFNEGSLRRQGSPSPPAAPDASEVNKPVLGRQDEPDRSVSPSDRAAPISPTWSDRDSDAAKFESAAEASSGGESSSRLHQTPDSKYQPPELAPYRLWSAKTALPSINLHNFDDLEQRYPDDHAHFTAAKQALDQHDWGQQWHNGLKWYATHKVDQTRAARVSTPFGGITGGDVDTSASPKFINDGEEVPRLDSIELTGKHKRINAFRELIGMIPPALTGHSQDVFRKHKEGGYQDVRESLHMAIQPIQYLNQMLRDGNGAVILENAISEKMHKDLQHTPPSIFERLQREREKETRSRGKSPERGTATVDELLGMDHAVPNKFWYQFYRDRPAFKIRHPLDTPLEDFAAFKPFKDALALKKV